MVLQFLHAHKKLATSIFSARQKVLQLNVLRSMGSGGGIRIPGVSSKAGFPFVWCFEAIIDSESYEETIKKYFSFQFASINSNL